MSARGAALWVLGYPDAARADAAKALRSAREFGHVLTLGNNLIFAAWIHFDCGHYEIAKAEAMEINALADEKGSLSAGRLA